MGSQIDIAIAYPYVSFDLIFGNPVMVRTISPKYNNEQGIDNRHIIFLGENMSEAKTHLYVIKFDNPLINLPPASV